MDIILVSEEDRAGVITMLPDDVANADPVLFCAVDTDDGEQKIIGVLAATITGNAWILEHIVVVQEMRRRGIGRALVSRMITMAIGALADEILLSYHMDPHADPAADAFFEAMGFTEALRSKVYAISMPDLGAGLKTFVKKLPKGHYVFLREIPGRFWESLRRDLITAGENYDPDPDTPAFSRMVLIDPGKRARYDEEVSALYLTDTDQVGGCILISPKAQGLAIEYLYSSANDPKSILDLVGIFCLSYQKALEKYGKDCRLFVNAQNEMSENLFLKLSGGKEEVYGVAVERVLSLS